MTDLLTPDDVRKGLALSKGISPKHAINADKFQRLCRNYLMLWDRVDELENRVANWEEAFWALDV